MPLELLDGTGYSTADYIPLLGTYSDHLTLQAETRRARLDALIGRIAGRCGGHLTRQQVGLVYPAHRRCSGAAA